MASYLHRTAQPPTLATFRSWGSSAGAGRIRLAGAKIGENIFYPLRIKQIIATIGTGDKINIRFCDKARARVDISSMSVNIL